MTESALSFIIKVMNGWLFVLLFFLISCDYLIPNQPTNSNQTTAQQPVTSTPSDTTSSNHNNPWGIVKCNSESEFQEFNKQVRQFISTKYNPNKLPAIGCLKNHTNAGRVFFKGSVSFEGGAALNPSNPSSSLKVAPQSSYIEVHIDTATDEQRDKKIKPPVQVSPVLLSASSPVAGEVSNGQAVLNFKDSSGEVRLEGEIQGERFEGRFIYKNYKTWENPSEGFEGVLGTFAIRTCAFFKCS